MSANPFSIIKHYQEEERARIKKFRAEAVERREETKKTLIENGYPEIAALIVERKGDV